ncbi:MAG: COX aromatic rich motif-containing protein [Chlamydiales bacterium]
MGKIGFIIGVFSLLVLGLVFYFVLSQENALVTQPKGIIASSQLDLIKTNVFLMLLVIVPTFLILLTVALKYRASNLKAKYDPNRSHGVFSELLLWTIPSIIVVIMAMITWKATFKLDPYRPLESEVKPLSIQVVALDWKWLFIYPDYEIASLNFVQFPEKVPIHFSLAADGSPMNSFWVPQLSGQIYCMTGMVTSLHVMADGPGEYSGKAAEINGAGYADMTFVAKSTSQSDFQNWVEEAQKSSIHLTDAVYEELLHPSLKNPVTLYSHVDEGLFNRILMRYVEPKGEK